MPPRPRPNLTEGPIAPTLFRFTLPILFGNVLQSINASINAIWIGHYLGPAALSASSIVNSLLFFLIGLMFGVSMATTILVGQSIGQGNLDEAKRAIGTSAGFFSALASLFALVGVAFAPQLLAAMRTPPDALPFAIAYLRVIAAGVPFIYLYNFLMMSLRGAGDSRTPFLFLLISVGLDVVLNPLLIFGGGPVPALGIAGSATATNLAQLTSLLALVWFLYRSENPLRIRRHELHYLVPDRVMLRALVVKGGPMGLQMIVLSLSMIVMISLVNRFGSGTSAAYGACLQLWNYIQMPAFAVGQAVSAMAAQNVGAGRWNRVDRVALTGVGFNLLLTGGLVLLVYAVDRPVLSLFLPDPGGLSIAQHIDAIVVWSFVLFGATFVLLGVVRATGAVVPPLIMLFIAFWLVRLPFAFWLIDRWKADAIWWSLPLGSLVSLGLAAGYYRWGGWRHARMLVEEPRAAEAAAVA